MRKEKQIEEMARKMCRNYQQNGSCAADDDTCQLECIYGYCAESIYCAGYRKQEWIPANEPPKEYRDEYGELIPFLVCEDGTEYPFRAMYDGKSWGDGLFAIPVTHWMPLPEPPKGE